MAFNDGNKRVRQRPYSIRTRIKTGGFLGRVTSSVSQRPYSIRTRIKTHTSDVNVANQLRVRDHIPLEQGLRLKRF